MSEIISNCKYAPGIATYGAAGKQGKIGLPGYSLYFIPYNIDILSNNIDKNTQYEYLINCIKNNRYITNNSEISTELLVMKDRTYQIGDLFLLNNGKILRLSSIINDVKFEDVGELFTEEKTFIKMDDKDIIYNNKNMNVILTDNTDDILNNNEIIKNDSLLSVVYYNDHKNLLSFIDSKNSNNINFKLNNKSLLIDSSNGVYFNNVFVKNNNETISDNEYYKVTTFNDNEDLSFYTVSDDGETLTIHKNKLNLYCEVLIVDESMNINRNYVNRSDKDEDDINFIIKDSYIVEILIPLMSSYLTKTIKIK